MRRFIRFAPGSLRRVCSPGSLAWLWATGTLLLGGPARARALDLCTEPPLRLEKQGGPGVEQSGFRLFAKGPRGSDFERMTFAAERPVLPAAHSFEAPVSFDSENGTASAPTTPKKNYWMAAGEVLGVNVGLWLIERYILKEPWSFISPESWKANLKTGLVYDHHDDFPTNQTLHPFNGSIYYNAARTNGLSFWESSLFAAAGSLMWEYFGETEAASLNDVLTTALGGAVTGEVFYRLSTMLLDNTAGGASRFWRELGAAVLNPPGLFNRHVRGELTKDFPNPDDRMPAAFSAEVYAGYQRLNDGPPSVVVSPNQGLLGIFIRYGDPFSGRNSKPFDSFEALIEVYPSSSTVGSRWWERGLLASWGISSSAAAEHRLGLLMGYEYTNNQSEIFSAQTFSVDLLSRFPLSRGLELRTEVMGVGFPVVALQANDAPYEFTSAGRPYDFGVGGGVRSLARLDRAGLDLLSIGYEALWTHTTSGASNPPAEASLSSRLQSFRVEGRLPVSDALAVGGGWTWNDRVTAYPERTAAVAGPEWRVFASVLLR